MANPIIDRNGTRYWYKRGKRHREDGPAVIHPGGEQFWYYDGKMHSECGPAIIYPDGRKWWFLDDVNYTFDDYCDELNLTNEDILLLKIKYD